MTNPFATINGVVPWYSFTTGPAARHWNGQTWLTWQAATANAYRIDGTVYDHAADTWTPFTVGPYPLVDDDHGSPALLRDADGYWHCFYGAHNSPLKHSRTTAPDTPTWQAEPDLAGANTYARPLLVGSTVYLFYRRNDGGQMPVCLRIGTHSGGSITWALEQVVFDFGSDTRSYLGLAFVRGTDIVLVGTRADPYTDQARRDQYVIAYDTITGLARDLGGVAWTLPLSRATLDAGFRVVQQPYNRGDLCAAAYDAGGRLHLVYADGNGQGPFPLMHTYVNGACGWTLAQPIAEFDAQPTGISYPGSLSGTALIAQGDGVAFWWPVDSGHAYAYGGSQYARRAWSPTTGWTTTETMLTQAGSLALNHSAPVADAHPDARLIVGETSQVINSVANETTLRLYLHGDSGWLAPFTPPPPPPPPGMTVLLLDGGDRSAAPKTLTCAGTSPQLRGGIWIFNGNNNLTFPDSPDWTFDGDFTVEAWVMWASIPTTQHAVASHYDATTGTREFSCMFDGTTTPKKLTFLGSLNGAANTNISGTWSPTPTQRHALCWERAASTVRLYVDGVMVGTGILAGALFESSAALAIGAMNPTSGANNRLVGEVGPVRITKAAALYANDAGYTVPTLPLPAP